MEAQKLKKKKQSISKDKIKKTIKNVICRPDAAFWPVVLDVEEYIIKIALKKQSVHIPVYRKPHWNEIKLIPKNERPKPAPVQRVEGLIFGISECCDYVKAQKCAAVLIEANVNPPAIVQQIIEACTTSSTPVLCIKGLRQLSYTNFGIKTSCLGVKENCLQDLSSKIRDIYQNYKCVTQPEHISTAPKNNECLINKAKKEELQIDVDSYCPYLYRTDNKSRVFVPNNTRTYKVLSEFTGQNYLKMSQDIEPMNGSKPYMKMLLKKMTNNPNRHKTKYKT